MQDEKISIIVPAYNVEGYIKQCIDSLVNQTYKNTEIIIVNDGSTDNTLKIINDYAKRDSRIIVINQENRGVSESRNSALDAMTGQYVVFVDSDDWLDLDACEFMIKSIKNNFSDIGIFGYYREYDNSSLPKTLFNDEEIVFNKNEIMNNLHRRIFGPVR